MSKPAKAAIKEDIRSLSGAERAAIIMLSLGEEHSQKIWQMMDEDEIKEVLLQSAIYCGVPAANSAFAIAQKVLEER